MKKLIYSFVVVLTFGFSSALAQVPDAIYLLGAVGNPIDVIAPDLNNDGYPDLVFITETGDSLITMLGNGTGTFTNRRAVGLVSTSIDMVAIAAADFNNDGNMDVVAASLGTTNVIAFAGDGTGALNYYASGGGSPAIDVVVGNFDSYAPLNLNADIALLLRTGNATTDSIYYYFGAGTGFFPNFAEAPTGGKGAYLMTKQAEPGSLPELDNIAVANFSSANIGLVISGGDRTFSTVTIPARATNPGGVAWDYFNNDGLLDLAYTGWNNDSLYVQMGTSLTTYSPAVSYPLRGSPFGLASGDFTGDGKVDLAAVNLGNDSLSFYVNNGSGGFLPIINAPVGFPDRRGKAADINNDGVADLLVGAASGNYFGIFNFQSPSVTPATLTGNPPAGAAFTLPVITARDSTNIASVKLLYRQMGKSAYDTLTLTPGAGTATQRNYTGTLPAGAMTDRGLEYAFRTSDGFTASNHPAESISRLRTTVNENAPATPTGIYQLVSFPFAVNPDSAQYQIADNFSLTDPKVARLFWWDPILADTITTDTTVRKGYREYPKVPGFFPGRSMFLGTTSSTAFNGVGLSTLADTLGTATDFVRMHIDSGWNMIATPYGYPLMFDSVSILMSDSSIHDCCCDTACQNWVGTSVREYIGGTSYTAKHVMLPWRGYFAFNNRKPITLLFPKREMVIPNTNLRPALEHEVAWPVDWKISVSAKSGDVITPSVVLGTSKNASEGRDALDLPIPPALPGDFRIAFQKGKEFGAPGDYLSDIRPTLTSSETWSFTIQPGGTRAIEMGFDGLADVPADHDVILTDKEGRARQNLRLEPVYRFIAVEDRHFELTITPKVTGQTALLPTHYELYQNMPNPFNPQTLIKYDLPEAASVRLDVFNILGQRVTTLVNRYEAAGPKSVLWDGTDQSGSKVSSGIYLYKISAGDYTATKKMIYLK